MDLKEAGKRIGVLVVAGLISTVLEIVVTKYISGAATAAAHIEVEKALADAVQQMRAQQLQQTQQARAPTLKSVSVEPQKTSNSYSVTV